MNKPRCSKCGRPLSNPESIARGMGPVCAGLTGRRGKGKVRIKTGRSPRRYAATGVGSGQLPLFVFADSPRPKKKTKRQRAKEARAYRKSLFENRQPFSLTGRCIAYVPTANMWEDSTGNRYSTQYLADYMRRHNFV